MKIIRWTTYSTNRHLRGRISVHAYLSMHNYRRIWSLDITSDIVNPYNIVIQHIRGVKAEEVVYYRHVYKGKINLDIYIKMRYHGNKIY